MNVGKLTYLACCVGVWMG